MVFLCIKLSNPLSSIWFYNRISNGILLYLSGAHFISIFIHSIIHSHYKLGQWQALKLRFSAIEINRKSIHLYIIYCGVKCISSYMSIWIIFVKVRDFLWFHFRPEQSFECIFRRMFLPLYFHQEIKHRISGTIKRLFDHTACI